MSRKATQQDTAALAAVFQQKAIRRTLHNDEWWFVITDIVAALTDAADPSDYWKKMRRRDPGLSMDSQRGGKLPPLSGGNRRRCSARQLRQYRRIVPHHPIHYLARDGVVQQLAGTTAIAWCKDAQGFADNRNAAKEGCAIAGNARKELETKSGKPVVSRSNYFSTPTTGEVMENGVASENPSKRKAIASNKK